MTALEEVLNDYKEASKTMKGKAKKEVIKLLKEANKEYKLLRALEDEFERGLYARWGNQL